MPSGGGQRKCKCGQFYLLREAIKLELDAEAETPHTVFVDAAGVHIKPSSSTLWQALARRAPQMEKGLLQASIQQQVFQKIAQAMFMLRTPITTLSDKLSRNDSSSTQTNCQLFPLSNRQPTLTTPSLVNTRA